tara:strand:- start:597 stop:1634 length:1038 start_codon:yes stop_codon:yes gene_type:complete
MASAKKIAELVRGFAVDQVVQGDGVLPTFTDQQVIDAINFAKADLFSKRPEAFSSSAIVITEPSDITDVKSSKRFLDGDLAHWQNIITSGGGYITASNIQHGKIEFTIRIQDEDQSNSNTEKNGGIFLICAEGAGNEVGEPMTYGQLEDGKIAIRKDEAGSATTDDYGIISTSKINDGQIHHIQLDGTAQNTITLSIDGTQEASISNTSGIFDVAGVDDLLIPGTNVTGTLDASPSPVPSLYQPYSFNGIFDIYEFVLFDNSGVPFFEAVRNNTFGNDLNASLSLGSPSGSNQPESKSPSTLDMLNWAITPLSQKAASVLLSQQSKDVFYREASVALDKIYNGSI